jgi:hypothetical protein
MAFSSFLYAAATFTTLCFSRNFSESWANAAIRFTSILSRCDSIAFVAFCCL